MARPLRLDRRDAHGLAEPVADRGGEKPNAAVQVEVGGTGIEEFGVDQVLHGPPERGGRSAMHLPEPSCVKSERAVADALLDRRARAARSPLALDHDDRGFTLAGCDEVDGTCAGEPGVERRRSASAGTARGRRAPTEETVRLAA